MVVTLLVSIFLKGIIKKILKWKIEDVVTKRDYMYVNLLGAGTQANSWSTKSKTPFDQRHFLSKTLFIQDALSKTHNPRHIIQDTFIADTIYPRHMLYKTHFSQDTFYPRRILSKTLFIQDTFT